MGRIVRIDDGRIYTYSEDNLDTLKEQICAVIEEHKRQLFDIRLLGGIRGGEPYKGSDAHKIRLAADKVLIDLRSRFIEAANSQSKKGIFSMR